MTLSHPSLDPYLSFNSSCGMLQFTGDLNGAIYQMAFLIGVRSDAKTHLLITCLPRNLRKTVHVRFTSSSVVLRSEFTGEGGDDGGLVGALIMNGDIARFLVDGSGWVHGIYVVHLW
ncbi:hypothetical protein B0H13DRAFT_1851493 [Mycena leptocephala]|nr:hypothetical protein B0H13DRAFT_1851493 [Mycena leptocephala]